MAAAETLLKRFSRISSRHVTPRRCDPASARRCSAGTRKAPAYRLPLRFTPHVRMNS